jgi:hypothetical protein
MALSIRLKDGVSINKRPDRPFWDIGANNKLCPISPTLARLKREHQNEEVAVARFLKNLVISVCFGLTGVNAYADQDVCQNLAGKTVFVDMLYGMAGGALISGIYMVADDNYENGDSKAAYGALAGGALGVGVGLAEVFSRKCTPEVQDKSGAFHSKNNYRLFAAPASRTASSLFGFSITRDI